MRLRIAIAVQGRFHAFDLTRELLRRGHDVQLYTNYPAGIAARFGVPQRVVHSFLLHGIGSRLVWRLFQRGWNGNVERVSNSIFGRWAATQLRGQRWDIVYGFSGVSEEIFAALRKRPTVRFLARSSTHIVRQRQLLDEEEVRAGVWVEKPSDWIVAREQREYALADAIHLLGHFPLQSFLELGEDAEKLYTLHLGVDVRSFRAPAAVIAERKRRVRAGEPLRVLNVGTFCLRKGALDYVPLIRSSGPRRFCFRFVGPVASDALHLWRELKGEAEFVGKRPQAELPGEYAWGDLFLLPTVEDGFGLVLPQALACGLPVLTTLNCGAADLIEHERNGWVLPARRPELLLERLRWCDEHRDEFEKMVTAAYDTGTEWDWAETARETEASMLEALAKKRRAGRATHAV